MKKKNVRIVWSNLNIDVDNWKDGYIEHLEANGLSIESVDNDDIFDFATETNNLYLDDERTNLDIELPADIIAIADVGRWNCRVMGYRVIGRNVKDCLYSECESAEWYADHYGNFRFTGHHHDGTNKVLYRMFRPELSDEQREHFTNKIYNGKATDADISRYTVRIGDFIGDVYGWKFSGRRPNVA